MTIEGNIITVEKLEMKNIIAEAVKLGIMQFQVETLNLPRYLSKNKAFKMYGRRLVEFWIDSKLIKEIQDGPGKQIRLDRVELEQLAATSNRVAYYQFKSKTKTA